MTFRFLTTPDNISPASSRLLRVADLPPRPQRTSGCPDVVTPLLCPTARSHRGPAEPRTSSDSGPGLALAPTDLARFSCRCGISPAEECASPLRVVQVRIRSFLSSVQGRTTGVHVSDAGGWPGRMARRSFRSRWVMGAQKRLTRPGRAQAPGSGLLKSGNGGKKNG
jgi:hypothetical protein